MKKLRLIILLSLLSNVGYAQHNNTGSTPLEIRRNSTADESLKIGIGDRSGLLEYVQDYDEGSGTHDLSFNISSSISHFYSWKSNGNELFRINSAGNVGIGTTNPNLTGYASGHVLTIGNSNAGILELASNLNSNTIGKIDFYGTGVSKRLASITAFKSADDDSQLRFYTQPTNGTLTEMVRIDKNGNVGIGTTSPSVKLDVLGSIQGSHMGRFKGWATGGETGLGFEVGTTNSKGYAIVYDRTNSSYGTMNIQNVIHTSGSNGNVGIGIGNPSVKLDVSGSIQGSHMGRFKGWATGGETGLGFEIGTTNNKGYAIVYDRTNSSYGTMNIQNVIHTSGSNGNVGIGTTDPQSKLAVEGQIRATEVKVLADISVPDYVFEPDYKLRTLRETKEYISEHKHLPEIPSATEIGENGIDLGDMNMRLLRKIEELTLYQIELMEKLEAQQKRIEQLENK